VHAVCTIITTLFSTVCFAGPQIEQIVVPPVPIDLELVNRLWEYGKKRVGAPDDLPPPPITLDWEVPRIARMAMQYPTVQEPNYPIQISIAPRVVDMEDRLLVTWAIGHEITHYLFLMREFDWNHKQATYNPTRKHHCDPEFKDITKGMGEVLWNVYHSTDFIMKVRDEIVKSCANFPQQ